MRDSLAISLWRGDEISSVVCVRWAILPNSVCIPVAYTTPRPCPDTIVVPARTRFLAVKGVSFRSGSAFRAFGSDSPLIVAVFTRMPNASISLTSAGTLSPSPSRTTSPGTSDSTSRFWTPPSRKTFISCGSNFRNASNARSARYSCQNENSPLIRITPIIAVPSCRIP